MGDNCFVRFYNHSEESYEKQMLLFEMLKVCSVDY